MCGELTGPQVISSTIHGGEIRCGPSTLLIICAEKNPPIVAVYRRFDTEIAIFWKR